MAVRGLQRLERLGTDEHNLQIAVPAVLALAFCVRLRRHLAIAVLSLLNKLASVQVVYKQKCLSAISLPNPVGRSMRL